MNSKIKGDYSVSLCATYFLAREYQVLMPYGDRGHYDLVVEKDSEFQRVQCKWSAGLKRPNSKKPQQYPYVSLRVCSTVRTGKNGVASVVNHIYTKMDFDLLWIAIPSTCYLIPLTDILQEKKSKVDLTLYPKWDKYRVAVPMPTPSNEDGLINRMPPHLTNDDKATIKRLLKEGKSEKDISDILGITRGRVSMFKLRERKAMAKV